MNFSQYSHTEIADNDELRSNYIRQLFWKVNTLEYSVEKTEIPKVLIQYWHNLNEVPQDIKSCLFSWSTIKKQGFKKLLFDDNAAKTFISQEFDNSYVLAYENCHHPAMRCDYFRLCYIYKKGGFYVDADEFFQGNDCNSFYQDNYLKIQPFCYDIGNQSMVPPDMFFLNDCPSQNLIFYINNNPIIAPAYHPVIRLALHRATRLLLSSRVDINDIQSITGPGNLTACLVLHSLKIKDSSTPVDFMFLPEWEKTSICQWELKYRNDERNWRVWKKLGAKSSGINYSYKTFIKLMENNSKDH